MEKKKIIPFSVNSLVMFKKTLRVHQDKFRVCRSDDMFTVIYYKDDKFYYRTSDFIAVSFKDYYKCIK